MTTVHDVRIPCKIGDTITLWGFFDIHLDNALCDLKTFERDMQAVISDPKAYAIFGGDTLDMMFSKDDPRSYVGMSVKEVEEAPDKADVAVKYACDILRPLVDTGRVIGFMIGNHEQKYLERNRTNVIKRICNEFDLPYLGYECFVRLYFGYTASEIKPSIRRLTGFLHHGFGGSSPVTKGVINLERVIGGMSDIDFVMLGHIHKLSFAQEYVRCVRGSFGCGVEEPKGIALANCGGYKFRGDWEITKGARLGAIGAGRIYFDVRSAHGRSMFVETRVN